MPGPSFYEPPNATGDIFKGLAGRTDKHADVQIERPGFNPGPARSATDGGSSQAEGFFSEVVLVELFSGILPGSVAADALGIPVAATLFSEVDEAALRVASVQYPDAVPLGPIQGIVPDTIRNIIDSYPRALFVILGGPPCQDVSLLNEQRRGADGPRSGLRAEYARIYDTFQESPRFAASGAT